MYDANSDLLILGLFLVALGMGITLLTKRPKEYKRYHMVDQAGRWVDE